MTIPLAVVPVAGLGTRLLPATKSQPKEMLPVAKKPVVQYVVEELEANGVQQVLFITGKSKTSIENHFDFDHELMRNLREAGKEDLLGELEFERMPVQFFPPAIAARRVWETLSSTRGSSLKTLRLSSPWETT